MHPYNKTYQYKYIDSEYELLELCEHYATLDVLAIDTEFVRTQTLTPMLGLIQVFDKENVALIDPVAIEDLSAFSAILENQNIIKVAHSCSEDLEALWHHLGVLPAPVFDTQFAAAMLDMGSSVGYANLVEQLFSITVDKGESRTDWISRPLSGAQCAYASADVTHLMALYEHLATQIEAKNKTTWVYDEIHQLGIKKSSLLPVHLAYFNFKNNWKLRGRQLAALQMLARWRLEVAREENMAVNFVIKELALFEVASTLPENSQALFDCHNLYSKQARLYKDILLTICKSAKAMAPEDYPPRIQRLIEFSAYKTCLALVKELTEQIALEVDVPVAVIASKKQMNQLLKWCWFDFDELQTQGLKPDLLVGWRGQLVREYLDGTKTINNSSLDSLIAGHHEIKRGL